MLVVSQVSRNKFLVIVVKIYTEADFKVSWYCPILLDFFTYFQIFRPGWQVDYHSWEYIVNMSHSIKTGIVLRMKIILKNL